MGAFVTADPDTRIIDITKVPVGGLSSLDVVDDIYEALKADWLADAALQPLKFPFRSFGDPKTPTTVIGPYVFIDNTLGWRLRPYDADHALTLVGNLVPEDVTIPMFQARVGRTIPITLEQSAQALTEQVQVETLDAASLRKLLQNRMITDPVTGLVTLFDDDDVTPLFVGTMYEDAAGTQLYRGRGAEQRTRMATP